MRAVAPALLALVLLAQTAAAEFGPESEDGWPINVDGDVLRPPVLPVVALEAPADIARAYGLDAADPLNKVGPFTAYPYYPILTAEVQRLADEHPDLVKLSSFGQSTTGLDLWVLEIADFENADMMPLAEREVVWLDGGTHSNEYSGVYFVLTWAQFLLDEYATNETAKWIVENRHTFIAPMINPDGSHLFGRLNAKGVNVNRNYPVGWAGLDEDPVLNNPGPSAASEPETQAVMAAWDTVRPDYAASIHCCGNLWLYPYGIEGIIPVDEEMFSRICDEALQPVREDCGPIWSTIYPASGSSVDTAYELYGTAAFGFEMSGRGRLAMPWAEPFTMNDVREQESESWSAVLHAFQNVERYGANPRIVAVSGDATRLVVTLENDGYGNLTSGNLTLGGASVALPFLAPGERVALTLDGAFAAGPVDARLDYVKRVMTAPTETRSAPFTLVADGARLVGAFDAQSDPVEPLSVARDVPAPTGALLAVAALGAAMLLARRK